MDDTLKHYGILGMKWGVRRSPDQLARARGDKGSDDSGGEKKSKLARLLGSKKSATPAPKKVTELTDEELRSRINRLNMERQYRDLEKALTPQKKHTVKKLLSEAMENLGRKSLNKVVDLGVDKIFGAKGNDDYDIETLNAMDIAKMTPAMLKKAAETYGAAGKIDTWRKKLGGEDKTSETKTKESTASDAKEETSKSTESRTDEKPKASTSNDVGMSFADQWLYGQSGKTETKTLKEIEADREKRDKELLKWLV